MLQRYWNRWLAATLLFFLAGCRQQPLPEVTVGEPVFSFSGTIAGESVELIAGENGDFMHIGYEHLPEELFGFEGQLAPESCRDCPAGLTLEIRDQLQRDVTDLLAAGEAPQPGAYPWYFEARKKPFSRVTYEWDGNGPQPMSMQWDLGDGSTSTQAVPVHEYRDTTLQTVTVCLAVQSSNGCNSSVCQVVNLVDTACQAAFRYEVDDASPYVRFEDASRGQAPFRYRWTFGDGFTATLGNPGYFYGQENQYEVCLEILDAGGCRSEVCKTVSVSEAFCGAGFQASVQRLEEPDPLQPGAIALQWQDANGTIWRSDRKEQPQTGRFRILDAERYPDESQGVPAWKITWEGQAILYNEAGNELEIAGSGVYAIGVPLQD